MKKSHALVFVTILALSLGLCGCEKESASVGDVQLVLEGEQYLPFANFVNSRNKDGLFADGMRRQPQEVADELDAALISDDAKIVISGKTAGPPCYTLYDELYQRIYDCQEEFVMPEEAGRYILCVSVTWGTEKVYEGYQYFFVMEKQ